MKKTSANQNIDDYIRSFPKQTQVILKKIRQIIKKAAPKATETISYQMPAFKLDGRILIYFAAWARHFSLYPASDIMVKSIPGLEKFRVSTGTLKFPSDKPLPFDLITKVVKYKIKELAAK